MSQYVNADELEMVEGIHETRWLRGTDSFLGVTDTLVDLIVGVYSHRRTIELVAKCGVKPHSAQVTPGLGFVRQVLYLSSQDT